MAILTYIREGLISEMGSGDINETPPKFRGRSDGRYKFSAKFVNDSGKDVYVPMSVNIDTVCDSGTINVSFAEVGDEDYSTTDIGTSPGEKLKVLDAKMTGVVYCIKSHLANIGCEIDTILFSPIRDEKDIQMNKNRRATTYIYYAKKFLPQFMDITRNDIKVNEVGTKDIAISFPPVQPKETLGSKIKNTVTPLVNKVRKSVPAIDKDDLSADKDDAIPEFNYR
jgi:hypothetical protein